MKNFKYLLIILLFVPLHLLPKEKYIVIGWNDLGMHCANKDFGNLCILPPYNNIHAQAIQVGDALHKPLIVTDKLTVTYEIPGNTYSVGKTDFWTYAKDLFGVTLADNIGLTGLGLTGKLTVDSNNFVAIGIPLTPYTDADLNNEDPYQLALIKLYDKKNALLASTQPVIPVSNEIHCVGSNCHSSEDAILTKYAAKMHFDPNKRPVLCASCHKDNALGAKGDLFSYSLSEAMHKKHGPITNDCYNCHPGQKTHCFRDTMSAMGVTCQRCHGDVSNVGASIGMGRRPWFDEPRCGDTKCHGANFAEEPGKLFRQSRGHGKLFCSACHGSPHAVWPTQEERDNVQSYALQGSRGVIRDCKVCHGFDPKGPGPHGIKASSKYNDNTAPAVESALLTDGSNVDGFFYDLPNNSTKSGLGK